MKLRSIILPVLLILAANMVFAANIQGSIYDIELNELSDVIVEIDTTPKQSFVAKDGRYSFDVPLGDYIILAKNGQGIAEEKITITDDGTYNIDLILFPDFSEEEEILNDSDLEIGTDYTDVTEKNYSRYYLLAFVLVLIIIIAVILHYKKKLETGLKKELKEIKKTTKEDLEADLKELISFIKKEGGRTTQKDIRRNFPQSEAKISLMIAELEHKGKIKKIKKGRGNIIILI
ncbi:hypothetical protein KY346_01745 [Candidatus Woesearchaeota archaeon]|nr:hypothetical protein [Candidatus Woesearchaeota archaeon]